MARDPGPPPPPTRDASAGSPRVRYPVLDIEVDAVDPAATLARIDRAVALGERISICFANVHGTMEARDHDEVRRAYAAADLVVADGMPLVWLGRAQGFAGAARVRGPDLMRAACAQAARRGHSIFLVGGAEGVADDLSQRLRTNHPGLRVAGTLVPRFGERSEREEAELVAQINAADPDLLWVGLGCPRQELWMARHRPALNARVLLGVGAAFDFLTGRVAEAPALLGRMGLEWAFRLAHEPRRLYRRYLVLNPRFVWNVAKDAWPSPRRPPGVGS